MQLSLDFYFYPPPTHAHTPRFLAPSACLVAFIVFYFPTVLSPRCTVVTNAQLVPFFSPPVSLKNANFTLPSSKCLHLQLKFRMGSRRCFLSGRHIITECIQKHFPSVFTATVISHDSLSDNKMFFLSRFG